MIMWAGMAAHHFLKVGASIGWTVAAAKATEIRGRGGSALLDLTGRLGQIQQKSFAS